MIDVNIIRETQLIMMVIRENTGFLSPINCSPKVYFFNLFVGFFGGKGSRQYIYHEKSVKATKDILHYKV